MAPVKRKRRVDTPAARDGKRSPAERTESTRAGPALLWTFVTPGISGGGVCSARTYIVIPFASNEPTSADNSPTFLRRVIVGVRCQWPSEEGTCESDGPSANRRRYWSRRAGANRACVGRTSFLPAAVLVWAGRCAATAKDASLANVHGSLPSRRSSPSCATGCCCS